MTKLKNLLNSVLLIILSTILVIAYIVCEWAITIIEGFFHLGLIPIIALHCIEFLFLLHILNEVIEMTFDINVKNEIREFWKNRNS
jgi:hypothetical protein